MIEVEVDEGEHKCRPVSLLVTPKPGKHISDRSPYLVVLRYIGTSGARPQSDKGLSRVAGHGVSPCKRMSPTLLNYIIKALGVQHDKYIEHGNQT